MDTKTIDYCLLESCDSVETFLKSQFHSSGNKLKKYFSKSFLNRRLNEKNTLVLPLNFVNDGEINPNYEGQDLKILHEDETFFVFVKNPNQHIHPLTYDEGDNCLSWLRLHRPELLQVNLENYDRGLLYRLDYETSGVVVYAKMTSTYKVLREGFNELVKEKIYKCWVEGECLQSLVLKHSFTSSEIKGKKVLVGDYGVHEKVGELLLSPVRYDQLLKRTLVEVTLKTGLRHQIRAQLAHIGFPLAGDLLYGGKAARRLYLHAWRYRLNFEGKDFVFESEPNEFEGL